MDASPLPDTDHTDLTLSQWARAHNTGLTVVSKSEPEPVLLAHNLIAVVTDPEVARDLILKWERIQPSDAGVGLVAMSAGGDRHATPPSGVPGAAKSDPEKVTGHAGRRIIVGAIPGALIGAVIVGTIVAILAPSVGAVVSGALAGAAFGFVAGAFASFVGRTGWGEAYKESFVEPDTTDVVFASIHSDDPDMIAEAAKVASLPGDVLLSVDSKGHATTRRTT